MLPVMTVASTSKQDEEKPSNLYEIYVFNKSGQLCRLTKQILNKDSKGRFVKEGKDIGVFPGEEDEKFGVMKIDPSVENYTTGGSIEQRIRQFMSKKGVKEEEVKKLATKS